MSDLTLFDELSQLPSDQVEQMIFDYRLLSVEKREFVLQKTDETQWLLKKTAENIIRIGKNLQAVREILPHGMYLPWLQSEFGMSETSADRFRQVSNRFGGESKSPNLGDFSISALYLLAAPSTPQSAINEALKFAEDGKKVTHAMAQKIIEAEKAKEQAEKAAADSQAELILAQQHLFEVQAEAEYNIADLNAQIEVLHELRGCIDTFLIELDTQ
jgi:hypothetical protein